MKERYKMFRNKPPDGRNNIVGVKAACDSGRALIYGIICEV